MQDDELSALRAARRAFVLQAHPDRGGDPVAFREGLARFDALLAQDPDTGPPVVVGVPTPRTLLGRLRVRLARRAARRARRARLR